MILIIRPTEIIDRNLAIILETIYIHTSNSTSYGRSDV